MAYCTQDDLITAFGEEELIQLTDREHAGAIDAAVLAAALAKADAEIDRRLRVRGWSTPVGLASGDLRGLAQDMARFHLHNNGSVIPEWVQKAYDRALKTLDDYVRGVVAFDIGLPDTAPASAGDVDFTDRDRVFTDDTLAGF
jgi:phage gp36-like protein